MLLPSPAPQTQAQSAEPEGNSKKRRRIVQACEECRDRKRKCDGGRPVCGACSRRPGQSCVWNDDRNTKGWSNNYVEGLRARIKELESSLSVSPTSTSHQATQQQALSVGDSPSNSSPVFDNGDSHTNPPEVLPTTMPTPPIIGPPSASPPPAAGCSPTVSNGQTSRETAPSLQGPPTRSADTVSDGTDDGDFNALASDSCETDIDAMGVVRSTANGGTGRARRSSGYFGPSSTFSLLGDAYNAIHGHPGSDVQEGALPVPGKLNGRGRLAESAVNRMSMSFSVPRRAEADELVESYWMWVHTLYPFLHKPSFKKRYRSIWNGSDDRQGYSSGSEDHSANGYYDEVGDPLFHCMLNLVFAMGALFNPAIPSSDRDTVSRTFFSRAKGLMDLDTLACGSTILVQSLLLMSQYLQSTDAASSCWNTVGLAVRVAQGVGLHHEPQCCWSGNCEIGHSQLETEMRRRTWTGAVVFDRVLSMTYGRPLMIHPSMTKNRLFLPQPIDDEYLAGPGEPPAQQPPNVASVSDCYVAAVRLQDIIGEFIASFNHMGMGVRAQPGQKPEREPTQPRSSRKSPAGDLDLQLILDVEDALSEWHDSLPTRLLAETYRNGAAASLGLDPNRQAIFERQANVLAARYHHARLALLRPALSVLCKSTHEPGDSLPENISAIDSMNHAIVVKAANLCVSAARDLNNVITYNVDAGFRRLPAPWYSVFYVHSCAIVLLLGYLCSPKYISCMDEAALIESYDRCLSFFREYRPHSPSAQRCSKVLQLVQQQVFRHRNGPHENMSIGFEDLQVDTLHNGSGLAPQVGPLSDPRDAQMIFNQTLFPEDMQFDQFTPGRILDTNFDTTWLSHFTF